MEDKTKEREKDERKMKENKKKEKRKKVKEIFVNVRHFHSVHDPLAKK